MTKYENQIKGSYRNILNEYFNSSKEEKELGRMFYPNANHIARHIGNGLGFNSNEGINIGAGILSALSPRTEWESNIQLAFEFAQKKWASKQTKANNNKALKILEGEDPMIVLGKQSYKTKAFYKAVQDPYGHNLINNVVGFKEIIELAVIDRHAGGVYYGFPLIENERKQLSNWKVIKRISNAYIKVAKGLDISVNELQAITWYSFRNKFQNKYALTIRKGRKVTK